MSDPPSSGYISLSQQSSEQLASSAFELSSGGDGNFSYRGKVEGYEYEFVPPPDNRYECAICLLVLREPRQTPCGHRFCRDCIVKWLRESHGRCPVDNSPVGEKDLFPDNFAKREIQNFNVKCPNSKQGCDIITTVKKIQQHLDACPLAWVPCPSQCASILLRRDLEEHLRDVCERRPIQCPSCGEKMLAYNFQTHHLNCPLTRCQFCEEMMDRKALQAHYDSCPKALVDCTFSALGCTTQVQRCDESEHLTTSLQEHMCLLCQGVVRIMEYLHIPLPLESVSYPTQGQGLSPVEMSGAMSILAQSVQHMNIATNQGESQLGGGNSASLPVPSSQPFPASSHGRVVRSLDSSSPVPGAVSPPQFSSDPKASMQSAIPSHGTQEASMLSYTSRPSDFGGVGSIASYLPGAESEFISLKTQNQYQDESLARHSQSLMELQAKTESGEKILRDLKTKFNELEGRLCGGQFYWRIRSFARYQREAESGETPALHSQPFYTSPSGGYKLCVRANLNGVDSARGSHLSLFIHFMQGEYDDILDWPFTGRIILSVIDQNVCCELRNHVAETLASKPNLAAFQRPTTPRNHKGFGYMEFLPLSVLKNSSYICNDTLIIKAQVLPNG